MSYANLASATKLNRISRIITDIGTSGLMKFYTGAIPANPDIAPTGILLATLPLSATAGVASFAVQSSVVIAAGTGGTDGVYALIISGGGGSGATGIYTVTGGHLASIAITSNGAGYTSVPTLGGFGTAGLSGANASAVMTGILVFNSISSATAVATGTAGLVRVTTSSGTGILDMDIGITNAFSVVVNNVFINSGGSVACSAEVLIEA